MEDIVRILALKVSKFDNSYIFSCNRKLKLKTKPNYEPWISINSDKALRVPLRIGRTAL